MDIYCCSSETIEKYVRFFAAVLGCGLAMIGIALVFIGSSVDTALFQYSTFIIPEEFANSSRACVLFGVSLFGIVALQLCGTVRKWCFLLSMNTALLGYLVVMAVFVIQYTEYDMKALRNQLIYLLLVTLKRYGENTDDGKDFRRGWTMLQISKSCCGTNNYTDWKSVTQRKEEPKVPISCCKHVQVAFCSDKVNFNSTVHDSEFIYTEGCYQKAIDGIHFEQIVHILFVFIVVGGLSTICSAYLSWKWRNSTSQRPQTQL